MRTKPGDRGEDDLPLLRGRLRRLRERVAADGQMAVRGDPDHPANFGKALLQGLALGETLGLDGRLLEPEIDGQPATWDAALDLVADKFTETIMPSTAPTPSPSTSPVSC
jgi:anaerobic selenocysteine-containing dehydrogenase